MTVKEAARKVLRTAGRPLPASEITKRMLDGGLWLTAGKTPEATVAAQLSTDVKRQGQGSSFVRVARGTYGLRELGAKTAGRASRSKRAKTKTLSFTNAAEKILAQFAGKKPMHYRDITAKALENSWLLTEGKTPEATMYAQILSEIKRSRKRGKQPRFVQHGRGYVGLSQWMGRGLVFEIEQHNRRVRDQLHKHLLAVTPEGFEELVGRLLAEIGFEEIEVTRRSGDGGIDVRGVLVVGEVVRIRMAVQAKKWKKGHNVQAPTVQQVRGSLGAHEQGLIITTSGFSPGAKKEASRPDAVPVALMDGEQLVALLVENDMGVSRQTHAILDIEASPDS